MGYFDDNGKLAPSWGMGTPWGPVIDSGIPGNAAGMGQTSANTQLELERLRAQERAAVLAAQERSSQRSLDAFANTFATAANAAAVTVPAVFAAKSGQPFQLAQQQQSQGQSSGFGSVLPWVLGGLAVVGIAWFAFRGPGKQD